MTFTEALDKLLSKEAVDVAVAVLNPFVPPNFSQYVFKSVSDTKYPVLSPIPTELLFIISSGDSIGTSANNL